MRKSMHDLSGKKFNKLTVIKYVGSKPPYKNAKKRPFYLCRCDCGKEIEICGKYITCNHIKSCGCHKIDKCKEGAINRLHKNGTIPSYIKNDSPNISNTSTKIKNIYYNRKDKIYEVSIQLQKIRYRQRCKTLEEAIEIKQRLKEKYIIPFLNEI